jgi:MYXO-CTERM domain-containing protein
VRALVFVVLTACTVGGSDNRPVTARPPHDPDRMPSETLDHQDPRADTSDHPVLSRSEACNWFQRHFTSCGEPAKAPTSMPASAISIGCGTCSTSSGNDPTALLLPLAVLLVVSRRRNKS